MRRLSPVLSFSFSIAAAGCTSAAIGDVPGSSDIDGVKLASDLRLLENNPNCEDAEVAPDRVTYLWRTDASDVDVGVGSLLVGAKGGGYVRRVTSVEADGNTLDLATEPASLADAVVAGDLAMPLVQAESQDGGGIDLSNIVLFDGDVGGVPVSVRIPSGSLDFTPAVDFDMSIGFPGKINHLSGTVSGTFAADFEIEAQAGAAVELDREIDLSGPDAPLYSYPFTFVAPTPLGPLPIVGTVNLDVFVGFRAQASAVASVKTGVSATAEIAVGASYDDGEWTASAEPSLEASFEPIQLDTEGSTSVEAYARPEVSVVFYGVAGPHVALEPLLRVSGEAAPPDPLHTRLEACLRGELGFSVQIFSFSLADFSKSLERCETLFDSDPSAGAALAVDSVASR